MPSQCSTWNPIWSDDADKGLMYGANRIPVTMIGDSRPSTMSHQRTSIPTPGMYGERLATSKMTNISSRIFSERVSTSRTTKIFKERVSTSRKSYVTSTTQVIEEKMSPSLKAKIPAAFLGRGPSPLTRVERVDVPPPRTIPIMRSKVKTEKAKYEKKILVCILFVNDMLLLC